MATRESDSLRKLASGFVNKTLSISLTQDLPKCQAFPNKEQPVEGGCGNLCFPLVDGASHRLLQEMLKAESVHSLQWKLFSSAFPPV